jgi:hypothetical protein
VKEQQPLFPQDDEQRVPKLDQFRIGEPPDPDSGHLVAERVAAKI